MSEIDTTMFGYKFPFRIFTLSHKRLSDKRGISSKISVRNPVKHSQFNAPVIVMFLAREETGPLNPSGGKSNSSWMYPTNEYVVKLLAF